MWEELALLLLTTNYLLLATNYLLLATCYLLLTTHGSLLTSYYLLFLRQVREELAAQAETQSGISQLVDKQRSEMQVVCSK